MKVGVGNTNFWIGTFRVKVVKMLYFFGKTLLVVGIFWSAAEFGKMVTPVDREILPWAVERPVEMWVGMPDGGYVKILTQPLGRKRELGHLWWLAEDGYVP